VTPDAPSQHDADRLELTRRIYWLETIQEVNLEINSTHDIATIVRVILQSVVGTLGATSGAVYLLEAEGRRLHLHTAHGPDLSQDEIALSDAAVAFLRESDAPLSTRRIASTPLGRDLAAAAPAVLRGSAAVAPLVGKGRALGVIAVGPSLAGQDYTEEDLAFLRTISAQATVALFAAESYRLLERAEQELRASLLSLRTVSEGTVLALVRTLEMRDPYTAGHQRRVAELAAAIARQLGLPDASVEGIRMAGLIHDLGKISVPAEILARPGKINDIEFSLIKLHSRTGFDILKGTEFPWPLATIVLQHHECLDGSGYPDGIRGDAILVESRILKVADMVEATASHRPYRPARGIEFALAEMERAKGSALDRSVADACTRVLGSAPLETWATLSMGG
jgi:putative nucleotidyltransferase with HDIG domain